MGYKKNLKVLHILNELKFSGAEIMYVSAAPVFQSLGCELSVVNTTGRLGEYAPFFKDAGYAVFHKEYPESKKSLIKKYKYCKEFIHFLREMEYDIVHIHANRMMFVISFCGWIAGVKSIYTFHSTFTASRISYLFYYMRRWISKRVFKCTFQTISDSVFQNEKTYFYNDTVKINNWYNDIQFRPRREGEKKISRKDLGLDADALILISIGGCSMIKRHHEIIKALPHILKKYSNTVYLHLGEGYTLGEEQELAKELGVEKNILFLGNQREVRKYLIAADVYLMTSTHEGIPITTIEALGCGVPAVLYNVPGLDNFNKKKECSILIEEDYVVLAEKVIQISQDENKQKYLVKNGIELVTSDYNMTVNATKIYNLYL